MHYILFCFNAERKDEFHFMVGKVKCLHYSKEHVTRVMVQLPALTAYLQNCPLVLTLDGTHMTGG
jgi:hypothetical protein